VSPRFAQSHAKIAEQLTLLSRYGSKVFALTVHKHKR